MLIIRGPIKPYTFWIKIILAIFLAKTRPDKTIFSALTNLTIDFDWIIKNINAESAVFTLSCLCSFWLQSINTFLESNAQRFFLSKTLHSTTTRFQRANSESLSADFTLLESDTPRFCQLNFFQQFYTQQLEDAGEPIKNHCLLGVWRPMFCQSYFLHSTTRRCQRASWGSPPAGRHTQTPRVRSTS